MLDFNSESYFLKRKICLGFQHKKIRLSLGLQSNVTYNAQKLRRLQVKCAVTRPTHCEISDSNILTMSW